MKRLLTTVFVLALAAPVWALPRATAPYYAKGDWNAWGTTTVMTDMGGGHWQVTVAGLLAGDAPDYKIADAGWTESWPGSNGKAMANASGEITHHLYLTPPADGWEPATGARVGYDDSGMHGWDIMGSFNGWAEPGTVELVDNGGGMYSASYVVPVAGTYDFKFRKDNDWLISIGGDFGNAAGNAQVTTTNDGDTVTFQLDLPNGRWRTTVTGPVSVEEESWGEMKARYR